MRRSLAWWAITCRRLQNVSCFTYWLILIMIWYIDILFFPNSEKVYIFKPKANRGGDKPTTWPVTKKNKTYVPATKFSLTLPHYSLSSIPQIPSPQSPFFLFLTKKKTLFYLLLLLFEQLFIFLKKFWLLVVLAVLCIASTFVSTLAILFCPLFGSFLLVVKRVSCSAPFYSLQTVPKKEEDNGGSGITLKN